MNLYLTILIVLGLLTPPTPISEAQSQPIPVSEESISVSTLCSCVLYVRSKGVDIPKLGNNGTPDFLKPNSIPAKGVAILFTYDHIAYIEKIETTGMWISETNKEDCKYTERFLLYDDPTIRGFYK